jgi:hypothetical protein
LILRSLLLECMIFETSLFIPKGIDVLIFCAGMFESQAHLFLLLQEVKTVNGSAMRTNRTWATRIKDTDIGIFMLIY